MKRSEALMLIANQIDFIEGRFSGMRTNFSDLELSRADVILATMEDAGMKPPGRRVERDLTHNGYGEEFSVPTRMNQEINEWEEE